MPGAEELLFSQSDIESLYASLSESTKFLPESARYFDNLQLGFLELKIDNINE